MPGAPVDTVDILREHERIMRSEIHTSLPGKVVSYDAATQRAAVELMCRFPVEDADGEIEYEEAPILPSVPVVWPRAGGYVLTLPITAGDFVWVMFSEASLAEWRSTGQISDPVDARRHSLGWPVAIPGAWPDTSPLASGDTSARQAGLVIGKDGGDDQIRITTGEIKIGADATDYVALKTLVENELNKIKTTLGTATSPSGNVTYGTPYTVGSVGATRVKAK